MTAATNVLPAAEPDVVMILSAIDPADPIERQNEKLIRINRVLMRRVEQATDDTGAAYAQFQRAALLEGEVRARTRELEHALDLLNETNTKLAEANRQAEAARANLAGAIEAVRDGFALFDEGDRLVMANSRFGMDMPDVRERLAPGLAFDAYVLLVSRSASLALPDGQTAEGWLAQRRARHTDEHVVFNVALTSDRWMQVSEHRTATAGTVILQTDVTDIMRLQRRERERMLGDQARVIRATLEHITQGVTIFDPHGRLAGWNQRAIELLSLPLGRCIHGVAVDDVFGGLINRGLASLSLWIVGDRKTPFATELVSGGHTLDVFAQKMPDGGTVVSFTDVTAERDALAVISQANETLERRVAERTLELQDAVAIAERANATKSRFVAAASHDLLQPLSAAKLYLSALEAETSDAPIGPVVRKAQSALGSVETILAALLDISRLDAGATSLDITDVPLATVLRQLSVEFQPVAACKGLSLRVVPSTALVRSDPTYFRRILQNLIANAVKYTVRGKIIVGARRRGDDLRLEVWDTGPGIPRDQRANIFKEFQRLNAHASAAEGMGLGLAIVDRACTLLRHPLGLYSAVGRGSCFHVTVPLSPRQGRTVEQREERLGALPALVGRVALLVIPEAQLRLAMTTLLETWGLGVIETSGPEEAVALLSEIGIMPDVALVQPPRGDVSFGAGSLRALRQGAGPIPAVVVTANRCGEHCVELRRHGARVIHKPIDTKSLQAAIVDLCGPMATLVPLRPADGSAGLLTAC